MPKIFDVVKAAGTYTDASGQEKTRWINCGMIVKNPESGKLSLKLDSLPLGTPSEAGVGIWFALMEPQQRGQQAQPQGQPQAYGQQQPQAQNSGQGFRQPPAGDNDIPW